MLVFNLLHLGYPFVLHLMQLLIPLGMSLHWVLQTMKYLF